MQKPEYLDSSRGGTALDYLVRFELRRPRSDISRQPMIADPFSVPANALIASHETTKVPDRQGIRRNCATLDFFVAEAEVAGTGGE